MTGPGSNKGLVRTGQAFLAYLLLTLAFTYPLIRQFTAAIPGDSFDGWQNYWNLWWIKTALLEQHTQPWFTGLLYHPTGVSLLFHTLNAFNGFISLPVQLAWGLLPAYNVVVLFSFAAGGLGAYLLARDVFGPASSRLAAFSAGVIFTFAPYHTAHLLGHMQLIALEWLPFYALYLLRTLRAAGLHNPRPTEPNGLAGPHTARRRVFREAGLAALFLTLVALCDWYYVFYCLILTIVAGAWALLAAARSTPRSHLQVRPPRSRGQAALRILFAVCGIWLLVAFALSPLLIPMVIEARQSDYMVPDPQQSRTLSADLLAFVTPQEFHPLWGAWAREQAQAFKATVSEHQVFAGFTVLALAFLGAVTPWPKSRHTPMKALWLIVLIVFFLLSLGPVLHIGGRSTVLPGGAELPLPYSLLADLPFLNIMRSVSRLDVMVMLALGVLAAAGANWLVLRGRAGRSVSSVALALILFEFLPAPYPISPPDTPAWYGTLAQDERAGAVLNLPANWDRPGYLLYQTIHGKPLTAAYISRDDPRTLIERAPVLQHFRHLGPDIIAFDLAAQGQQVLTDLGVRWVVLDRYKMPGGAERAYTEWAVGEIFGDQPAVYEDERISVYELGDVTREGPYLMLGEGWGAVDAAAGTRSFTDSATLLVMADRAGAAILEVTLTPDSGSLAHSARLHLSLEPGANTATLKSGATGPVTVEQLALFAEE